MGNYLKLIFFIPFSSVFGQYSDSTILLDHLKSVIETEKPRNYRNINTLNFVANYIHSTFEKYSDSVAFQEFTVGENRYKNVICSFGTEHTERIIVGAHYDVCGYQDGADDNASAIAGILELARLFYKDSLDYRIDLVAYSLEEPPFFATENMGSFVHAQYLQNINAEIYGMVCLDMIGYYSNEKNSQNYPLKIMKLFFGSRGDYITAVQKFLPGKFSRKFSRNFKKLSPLEAKKFKGPRKLQGINFSDHYNYWDLGYSSVFITNSGFYRNPNYHRLGDSLETINLSNIAKVIDGIYLTIKEM